MDWYFKCMYFTQMDIKIVLEQYICGTLLFTNCFVDIVEIYLWYIFAPISPLYLTIRNTMLV